METTLYKRIQGKKLEMMFDSALDKCTIKFYEALNLNDENYNPKNVYSFRILVRHSDDVTGEEIFKQNFNKMFPPKTVREPKKKIYLVSTELGRKKGRISFYIAEILPNKGLRLIDNDFTCSTQSHAGIETEAIKRLIELKELKPNCIHKDGYIDNKKKNYILITAKGTALNYINQF